MGWPQTTIDGFYYLATPYSKYAGGLDAAYREACRAAQQFRESGASVYCPIETCHPLAMTLGLDPLDYEIWMKMNEPLVNAAGALVVVKMPGWQESTGVSIEVGQFVAAGKPVEYMTWRVEAAGEGGA